MENTFKKIGLLLLIVMILSFSSVFIAMVLSFSSSSALTSGNVAVIPIKGVISSSTSPWSDNVDPAQIRRWIEDANNDKSIQIIVLDINSPGGAAVASDEIGQAVRDSNKTVVAWIRDAGASGAYWIASNSDYIIANRMSITGSIGVTASYLEFGGTLARYNATYQEFHGGEYKEVGTPFREPTRQERELLQDKIDIIHEFFLEEVKNNRNLSDSQMRDVRTGEFFLGVEALELGLVDELGSKRELDAYLKEQLGDNELKYVQYRKPRSFIQELALLRANFLPQINPTSVEIRT